MSISSIVPTYRQLNPHGFFAPNAELIPEGEVFEFEGTPNVDMEAMNEPALKKLEEYHLQLLEGKEELERVNAKHYTEADLQTTIGEASADARRVSLDDGKDGGIPLLSGKKKGRPLKKIDLPESTHVIRDLTSTR